MRAQVCLQRRLQGMRVTKCWKAQFNPDQQGILHDFYGSQGSRLRQGLLQIRLDKAFKDRADAGLGDRHVLFTSCRGKNDRAPRQTWHNPRLLEMAWPPENVGERPGGQPTLQH